jgi:hypothetical protein
MEIGFFILGAIVLVVFFRLVAGSMDHGRIREYVASQGGRVVEIHWAPFGRGWFGEQSDRIYEIRYVDRDGNIRAATCKTSLFTGVYLTEDHIVRRAEQPGDESATGREPGRAESLAEENRRLREELSRLKGRI